MSEQLFAFVLMPFDKKLRKRYIRIQRTACEAGIRAERVDDQSFYRRGIVERIHSQIEAADFIIADMSKPNPNVFYEVGYASAKHKLCILLTNDAKTIPFDLRNIRHIVFYPCQASAGSLNVLVSPLALR
jgi:nucleoside 2-deoxyribosyltransferase